MFKRVIAIFVFVIGLPQAAHCQDNLHDHVIEKNEAAGQSASQAVSVPELLQKYTQALDATQSFTDTYEETIDFSYRLPTGQMKGRQFTRGQIRMDGMRVYCQKYTWGDFNTKNKDLPESAPRYNLRVVADKRVYSHSTAVNTPGVKGIADLQPVRQEGELINKRSFAGSHGYLGCDKRLDAVLDDAEKISIRPWTESVNGIACHVIDAHTKYGRYTVWLDPIHGYNAAKVTRKAKGGNNENERLMPQGDYASGSVVTTRFDQVGMVWVPVEADHKTQYTSGQLFRRSSSHYRRANIVLNPDHDKLGSFANPLEHPVNDPELSNNTRVSIWVPGCSLPVKYTWQDDKVIDEAGQVINVSQLWTGVTNSLLNKSLPSLTELSKDLSEIRSSDKSILVCFFDIEQRPSRNCIQELSKKAKELKEKGFVVIAVQASKIERVKLDKWIKENNIDFPIGMIDGDQEKTRFNWGVKSLPWLIVTDKEHVVTGEGLSVEEVVK